MRKSSKAALLSGLVFPGAGHLYLKRYISGAILVCASFTALYLIVANMIERAMQIVEKIERGEVGLDITVIAEMLSRQSVDNQSQLDVVWAVLIIAWIIAIADSYRCGRAQDRIDES
jgi:hypothetical protein